MLSMVVALVIPFLATKLKYDPALTSGPVATVIRDVLTLLVYFWIVGLFL
jgi:magnesium transporter